VFEEDGDKKYIQLDLEKRFRMINWKGLFGEANDLPPELQNAEEDVRNEMLEKLFAANKGISELTGASPESIDEMMKNPDLYSMINNEVNTSPSVVDEDGKAIDIGMRDAEADLERAFQEAVVQATQTTEDEGDNSRNDGDGGDSDDGIIDVEEVK